MERRNALISVLSMAAVKGFDPYIPFVQAWHETAGFTRMVGDWNYWGIKAPNGWAGKRVRVVTHEFVNGERKKIEDDFIDFDNPTQAMQFWLSLIQKSRHYRDAYKVRHDYKRFFKRLVNRDHPRELPWATDPKYLTKLLKLYAEVRKYRDLAELVKYAV